MNSVYIIDDDQMVRTSTSWLVQELGYRNHPFADASDFLDALPHLKRGCMLIDLRMEGMSGIELIRATAPVRAAFPAVVMTGHADVENSVEAMKAGAIDILQKPVSVERLADVLALAQQCLDPPPPPTLDDSIPFLAQLHKFTDRQTDVLRGLVAGRANKEIAADLEISTRTVEMHRAAVMAKLDVHSLPALLRVLVAATIRPATAQSIRTQATTNFA